MAPETNRRRRGLLPTAFIAVAVACACSSGSGSAPASVGSSDVCTQLTSLPCSEYKTAAECNAAVDAGVQSAQKAGCTAEYDAVLDCYAQHSPSCSSKGNVEIAPECSQLLVDYAKCDPNAVCTRSSSDTTCSYSCSDYAMSCQQNGTTWSCSCDKGAKIGTAFTSSDAEPCTRAATVSNCG